MNDFLTNPEVTLKVALEDKTAVNIVVVALVIIIAYFSAKYIFNKIK